MTNSPAALRRSLESRFKNASRATGQPSPQIRRRFFHQCYLARVFTLPGNDWVLKGGVGLAMRASSARHSKDIDLYRQDAIHDLETSIDQLITAGLASDRDPFVFEVTRKGEILGGAGGATLAVKCLLGPLELDTFPIDLTTRHQIVGKLEQVTPEQLVQIPQVMPPPPMLVYPLTDQIADKLSALYETHSGQPSSRYRDLVDLILITLDHQEVDPDELHRALEAQQTLRRVSLPRPLTPPGDHWRQRYRNLAIDTPGVPDRLANLENALTHIENAFREALNHRKGAVDSQPRPATGARDHL